jgi:hypothetical protein
MDKQITPEVKQRIFVQYWGQRVFSYFGTLHMINNDTIIRDLFFCKLELRSLSSIIGEEAKMCYKLGCFNKSVRHSFFENEDGLCWCLFDEIQPLSPYHVGTVPQPVIDYLRLQGFALPYLNWSIPELIAANVFVIRKEVGNDS